MEKHNKSRVNKIYLNGTIAILSRLVQVIMGFVVRRMFITSLGTEFLGYDAVFANILQILNLADLGIGVAVTSFLYKPLAEEDHHRIFALMLLFRRAYRIIGAIVFFVGICILGFLDEIIPDAGISIWDLRLLFFINLISCSATYFLAYKRILLNADQKTYITDSCDTVVFILVSLAQMTVLSTVPNYYYFLLLNAIKNVVSNIIINIKSDHFYGYINKHVKVEDIIYYRPLLGKYIKDIFVSRVGAMVYYATDHVIISVIRGSLLAGLLSNYTLITNVLLSSINQLFFSVQSTFGNYINVNQNLEEQKRMTDCYYCVHFIIGCFVMNCFALMVQPFIGVVFGKQLLLSSSTVLWLSINLLLSVLLQLPSQVFIIYKLFRHDRLIIILSTILNISVSVWLVNLIGIDGALIGTFVTSLIYLFSRFNIIARHVYHVEISNYLKKTFFYFMVAGISLVVSFLITKPILRNDYLSIFIWSVLIILCAALFPVTILCKTKDFQFIVGKILPDKFQKLLKPVNLWIMSTALIVLSLSIGFFRPGYALPLGSKSGIRLDSYVVEKDMQGKYFHLSIDDTSQCFKYISEHDAASIFEEPTFAWLKKIHDKYGVVVSCYVFYEDGEFSLSNMSEKYKEEFKTNSSWLKFGFHSRNAETSYEKRTIVHDYELVINELERIMGSGSIDHVIRLQSFKGSKDNIKALTKMKTHPIKGLLTSDDWRENYYLSKEQNDYIYCHDLLVDNDLGVFFISTDIRAEHVCELNQKIKELYSPSWYNQLGRLEIFTHEWALDKKTRKHVEGFCSFAVDNGYSFAFLDDIHSTKSF